MDNGDDLVMLSGDLLLDLVGHHRCAPFKLEGIDLCDQALGHVLHAHAEDAVGQYQHGVVFFDQVDEAGFHAGRPGTGHGDRQRVACVEQSPQVHLDSIHDTDEVWIEMTDGFFAQRLVDIVMNAGGAGAHQQDFFDAVQ